MGSSSKSQRLAIRIAAADKAKLVRAAAIQRRSVSEFVLASSREAAEHVLDEQTRFRLLPARHRAFLAALDAPTHEAAKARLAFEALPPLTLKGKAKPVAVFRPSGEQKNAQISDAMASPMVPAACG